jgi:hypothetical protein
MPAVPASPPHTPMLVVVSAPIAPPARDTGDLPPSTNSGPIHAEVLARVRQQAQRPGRVVAREPKPEGESRFLGSLVTFIVSAILIVALLVALAVVFRRAPTAPW